MGPFQGLRSLFEHKAGEEWTLPHPFSSFLISNAWTSRGADDTVWNLGPKYSTAFPLGAESVDILDIGLNPPKSDGEKEVNASGCSPILSPSYSRPAVFCPSASR